MAKAGSPSRAPKLPIIGIESGSGAGLASIGRRQTVEQEHQALSLCEDLGISTQYTIIMFHPVVFMDQGGMFEAPPPPMDAAVVKRDSSSD